MNKYRAWWKPEFDDLDPDERDEHAWKVPGTPSIFDPAKVTPCNDPDDAAEKYAEYFLRERDGDDTPWPIEVVVHDGEHYWVADVNREYEPTFDVTCRTPMELSE